MEEKFNYEELFEKYGKGLNLINSEKEEDRMENIRRIFQHRYEITKDPESKEALIMITEIIERLV